MPTDAQTKTLRLASEVTPLDAASAQQVAARMKGLPKRLAGLVEQMAGAQRTVKPAAQNKGLILLVTDAAGTAHGSSRTKDFLSHPSTLAQFAHQQQVKLAVTDIGLAEDFSQGEHAARIFKQRQALKAASPTERFWESVQAGVRMACLLRGKGTEVFGVGSLREFTEPAGEVEGIIAREQWEIAAMAGVILGAASVQTVTVIGGKVGEASLALAAGWSPVVREHVISADAANEFLGVSQDGEASLLGVVLTLGLCTQATQGVATP